MLENTNVSFKIGENASESNPPIIPGQFIIDAAADKQCLYLDTDEGTRIQLKDPTKMDVWGEVSNLDGTTLVQPVSHTMIGYAETLEGAPQKMFGISVPDASTDSPSVQLTCMDLSDSSYQTMVSQTVTKSGIGMMYYNTEHGNASMNVGLGTGNMRIAAKLAYNVSPTHYENEFGIDRSNRAFYITNISCPIDDMSSVDMFQMVVNTDNVYIQSRLHTQSEPRTISFSPDTDTRNFLIHGVCTPKEDNDVANKEYVDTQVSSIAPVWYEF